jgi:hypothetical protein
MVSLKSYSNYLILCINWAYINDKNIINYIKAQRLSWFGHLHRMPEERMVKKSIQLETDVKKTTRETKEQTGR